jgi:hypothetical protein
MHGLRKSVVEELHAHMNVRRIALSQMGRQDIDDDILSLCLEALPSRKALMVSKEEELLSLERLLAGHAAVLDFADLAYVELLEKIDMLDKFASSGLEPGLSLLGIVYSFQGLDVTDAFRLSKNVCTCKINGRRQRSTRNTAIS